MLEIRAFARKSLDRIFVLRRFKIENERCEMIDKARLEQKCSMWNNCERFFVKRLYFSPIV